MKILKLGMIKALITITFLLVSLSIRSQITLEHTYPGISWLTSNKNNMSLVHVGNGIYKYVYLNFSNFKIYNSNHSLYASGTVPSSAMPLANNTIWYFTTSMFDCDSSNIEYVVSSSDLSNPPCHNCKVSVCRTDGTVIFTRDSAMIYVGGAQLPIGRSPIMNSDNGTKMLVELTNGNLEIYDLCDSLPSNYLSVTTGNGQGTSHLFSYPNPSINNTIIKYQLPVNINQGEIVFYNTTGIEVKRFKVDRNFKTLQISTQDIPSGTYYYALITSAGQSEAKKHIVIK